MGFDSRGGGHDAYHPDRDRNDDRGRGDRFGYGNARDSAYHDDRGRGDRNNHREREDRDPRISNYNNDDPNVDAFGRRIRVKEEDQGNREMKREASDRHSDRDHYESKRSRRNERDERDERDDRRDRDRDRSPRER